MRDPLEFGCCTVSVWFAVILVIAFITFDSYSEAILFPARPEHQAHCSRLINDFLILEFLESTSTTLEVRKREDNARRKRICDTKTSSFRCGGIRRGSHSSNWRKVSESVSFSLAIVSIRNLLEVLNITASRWSHFILIRYS